MTTQTPTPKQPTGLEIICSTIKKMDSEFALALPENIKPEKFIKTVLAAIQTHPQKDKLANADRQTLYNACTKACADGLLLDGREATLVVFDGVVQYMPMVQGLVKLARNSGEITNIMAEVVYAKDKFSYRIGIDEMPIHEPDWFSDDRGLPVGAWALITLASGEKVPAILPKKKIMNIASKSKNSKQYSPTEGAYFDEWWKKTAIKNVLKYAPKSAETEKVIRMDEDEQEFVDAETGEVIPATKKTSVRSRVADKVKASVTPEPEMKTAEPAKETPAPVQSSQTIDGTAEKVINQQQYNEEEIPM